MRRALALLFIVALCDASPVDAQSWYFPNTLVPTGGDRFSGPYLGLDVTLGLKDEVGRVDGVAGSFGFLGERVGARVSGAVLMHDHIERNQHTFGGAIAFDLTDPEASFGLGVQGGLGWFDEGSSDDGPTFLRFPVGVVVKGRIVDSESTRSWLWAIPRVEIVRVSYGDFSRSENESGFSVGISSRRENGFGFFTAFDVLSPETIDNCADGCPVERPYVLGAGISFRFGG